jgi:cytochrome c
MAPPLKSKLYRNVGIAMMILTAGVGWSQATASEQDIAAGKTLYQNTCGGCHSVDEDRIGPHHRNIVGRPVASVSGFDYSTALKMLGGTWTPQRLDKWLSGTQKMAPGSQMYLELDDPTQRRLIIAFLESVSTPPTEEAVQAPGP